MSGQPDLFIGLISGTSIDGIDCALVRFDGDDPTLLASFTHPYDKDLRERLFHLCQQPEVSLQTLGEADVAVGQSFADAVRTMLAQQSLNAADIRALGSHGQTIYHKPGKPLPFTLQIGDPNVIALETDIVTVADFRRKDMAAGGQGAPLASLFHRFLFQSPDHSRVLVNLGGIANISVIARDTAFLGYDTGPASVLMDYWIGKHRGETFDANGEWAASGEPDADLLDILLDEPYFSAAEPKTTGREYFHGAWLEKRLEAFGREPKPEDVQATLLELTAVTVTTEIENQLRPDEVFLCGGGARNAALVARLGELLPQARVTTTDELGLAPEWVEAVTFAWLARQRLNDMPVDTPPITGASRPVVLGGVYLPG